ncbi:MAG: TetR/AcrR family transcriptional regulator [Flavobacteriales bacterium]|nr:TetR/AcrR family transcriptional regulator [Flavobacteriales bacterium]
MNVSVNFKMNEKLFLRNPEESELGKRIIQHSIILIHKIGFEDFTFKKLAIEIGTTEASVYRYFENKHRLLLYIVDWYWCWQEYRLLYETNNISNPETKLKVAIKFISSPVEDDLTIVHVNEKLLYEIVMKEGAKSYLTRHVAEDNSNKLFQPYKQLCSRIADLILEYNPKYKYPSSLSSTIVEMAHSQNFYQQNLPSLTDFNTLKDKFEVSDFIENLVFSSITK